MKIAFEALGFGKGDNFGGSAIVASRNAQELAARGHEVVYFCTNKKDKTSTLYNDTTITKINGVKVIYLKTYMIPLFGVSFGPFFVPHLKKYLDDEGPFDIVHLNEYRSFLAMTLAKWSIKKNIPFTIQPQGTMVLGDSSIFAKRIYDLIYSKKILQKATAVIPLTEGEKKLAIIKGVKEKNIKVISNGINPHIINNIPDKGSFRNTYQISKEKKIVLFVGRLDPIKGIDILIEAFAGLEDEKCLLVIIGPDHGFQDEIKKLIMKFNLVNNKVLLTGALNYNTVLSAMNDADILVVPSREEAFGMVILEAALLRKAMVISENCNLAQQFSDASIVLQLEKELFKTAIIRILNDQDFSRELGEKAYHNVKNNFQFTKVVDKMETLFKELSLSDKKSE